MVLLILNEFHLGIILQHSDLIKAVLIFQAGSRISALISPVCVCVCAFRVTSVLLCMGIHWQMDQGCSWEIHKPSSEEYWLNCHVFLTHYNLPLSFKIADMDILHYNKCMLSVCKFIMHSISAKRTNPWEQARVKNHPSWSENEWGKKSTEL